MDKKLKHKTPNYENTRRKHPIQGLPCIKQGYRPWEYSLSKANESLPPWSLPSVNEIDKKTNKLLSRIVSRNKGYEDK